MLVPRRSAREPRIVGVAVVVFGLVALAVAIGVDEKSMTDGSASIFRIVFGLFGAFAIAFGAYVLGVRLPRRILWSGDLRERADPDGTLWTVYPRPLGTRLWDVAGPLIGLGFAVGGIVVGLAAGAEGVPFVVVGALFLTVMVPGLGLGLRRALTERDSLRVGPFGIWLPAVGTIPWRDVEAIGVDDAATALSSMHPDDPAPMNQALRLTVTLRPGAVVQGRSGLDRYFLSIASLGRKASTLGVFEAELSVPLENVLETVGRYRPAEVPA